MRKSEAQQPFYKTGEENSGLEDECFSVTKICFNCFSQISKVKTMISMINTLYLILLSNCYLHPLVQSQA